MKLFKYALVLFMSVSMVSCGSDDDSSTNSRELTNENIMGSYNIR